MKPEYDEDGDVRPTNAVKLKVEYDADGDIRRGPPNTTYDSDGDVVAAKRRSIEPSREHRRDRSPVTSRHREHKDRERSPRHDDDRRDNYQRHSPSTQRKEYRSSRR